MGNKYVTDVVRFGDGFIHFCNNKYTHESIEEYKTTLRIFKTFDFGEISIIGNKLPRQFRRTAQTEFGRTRVSLTLSRVRFKLNNVKLFVMNTVYCSYIGDIPLSPSSIDITDGKRLTVLKPVYWTKANIDESIRDYNPIGLLMLKLIQPELFK